MIERKSSIKFDMWDKLADAIDEMIDLKVYERLVHDHSHVHQMHGTTAHRHGHSARVGYNRFLPWHRAYLIQFERELRIINPELSIPYWDWLADQSAPGQNQLYDFSSMLGTIQHPRTLGGTIPHFHVPIWNDIESEIDSLKKQSDYFRFAKILEIRLHNAGHTWIGGDMGTADSPRDPAFWFHHAQVDRLWTIWQNSNPGKMADLKGADAKMDPWSQFTVKSLNDTTGLGSDSYVYVD